MQFETTPPLDPTTAPPLTTVTPTRPQRLALRVLQLGAIAVVLAAATWRGFDLDRFLVPKELVLHATAVLAGLLTLRARLERVEKILLLFLLLSGVSALFATNPWLALRATAVSVSAFLIFRAARAVPSRPLLAGVALAIVVAAAVALLQAYGVELLIFSPNRAPGGTLGNRNFVGHAAAFGLPVVLLVALRGARLAPFGVAIVTAALILTRSRAAWIAAAAVVLVFLLGMLMRGDGRAWRRFLVCVLFAAAGGAAALLIPNTLRWRSDNPYLESLAGVASYDEGSGRGRLVQYERSLRMAAAHPLLGVGPGNWPVVYPEHAARRDPSLDAGAPGMTHNPWPSSDWIAFVSERGFAAAALLVFVFATIALGAFARIRRAVDADEALLATALLGTIAGAGAAGAFDAVLLLGAPALLVWSAIGALMPRVTEPSRAAALIALLLVIGSGVGAARSTAQLVAMELFTHGSRESLVQAARIDPGSFRTHVRLARIGKRAQRCQHANAAHALFPSSQAVRPCG